MATATGSRGATTTPASPPPAALSRQETLEGLLAQTKRLFTPIRKTFVQQGRGASTEPGPLSSFLHSHDARGLDFYLLLHAMASAEPWNCDYPAGTWVRALGLAKGAEPTSARGAVSKITRRLVKRNLITRGRAGRTSSLTLLREDGSAEAYDHPGPRREPYLKLPHAYWLLGHHADLSLPAKAMLLVAHHQRDGFYLPAEKAKPWYGISADSALRGLSELGKHGLITWRQEWIKNQRSDTGWIEQRHYTLTGPYARTPVGAADKDTT
jgi:hypothetical protein